MDRKIKILSLNVGLSHNLAGLSTLVTANNVDLVMLQEVRMSQQQFDSHIEKIGFKGEVNIDLDFPCKPGTAVAWSKCLPVDHVFTTVLCRSQLVKIGKFVFMNIYAPSGSEKRQERSSFFAQELFTIFNMFPHSNYFLSGDYNCVLSPLDV